MSSACFRTLRPCKLTSRLSSTGLTKTACFASGDAFFVRFYSIVTGYNTSRSSQTSGCISQCAAHNQSRTFHDSSKCLTRRPIPRKKSPPPKRDPSSPPFGILSAKELHAVFGGNMVPNVGNLVLQTLHQRRVEGSLIEYGVKIEGEGIDVSMEKSMRALKWLRDRYPVDEQAAAGQWADREAAKIQDSYISRAERLGLVKRIPQEGIEDQEQVEQGPAHSVIDQMKAYRKKQEAEAARRRKESGEEQRSHELRLAKVAEQRDQSEKYQRDLAVHREKQAVAGMISQTKDIPEMSLARRLGPSTLMALIFIGGFAYLANTYQPPKLEDRLFQDLTPSWATGVAIVGACTTITCLWHVPALWRVFNKYLLAVPGDPYVFSILGNCFSHTSFTHLGFNMAFVLFYGIALHDMVGRGNFLALYCVGGVVGSMTSMYWFVLRGVLNTYSSGASGAAWALAAAWGLLNLSRDTSEDNQRQFALDVARYCLLIIQITTHFVPGISSYIDVASHIGGAAAGVVCALLLQRRARATRLQQSSEVKEVKPIDPGSRP